MIFNILFGVYFFSLSMFLILVNPISCSTLLMVNASVLGLYLWSYLGYSWVSLLICMVYLGGVYIIMLFISSYTQNDQDISGFWYFLALSLVSFILICCFGFYDYIVLPNTVNICQNFEFVVYNDLSSSYLGYCVLLLSFFFLIGLSISSKDSFLR
uniref:NADH dehydrogenase subunit 6 n=1 Tax=Polylabris halichoeres TaxID=1004784 RepID=G3F9Y4_POLHA|nr:NADH dehydrogenase subunit 6 [Polylabris halichoeres]AEB55006.1 NADH dehydrogenase subunit 6 [Polylabris halichoeres]